MLQDHFFPSGYFMVPNEVFGSGEDLGWCRRLGPIGFALWALILRRYDFKKGKTCYESHASMARRLGVSEPTVEKYLKRLLALGLVHRREVRRGKRSCWEYIPRLPLSAEAAPDTQSVWVSETQNGGEIPKQFGLDTQNDEDVESVESKVGQEDAANSKGRNRLYLRLYQDISVTERVRVIRENASSFDQRTQVEAARDYWKHLWEAHYQRRYYRPQNPQNRSVVPKDEANLQRLIEEVSFPELVARMERCFEVCDGLFPCFQRGRWMRPIVLNDFVSAHFFNQWIPSREEEPLPGPKTTEEKIRLAREKRKAAASGSTGGSPSVGVAGRDR